MSLATAEPVASPVTRPVARQLRRLRGALATWFAVEGWKHVLAWLVGLALVDLVLDRYFRFDLPQRAVLLALGGGWWLWVVYRWLWRPLATRPSDDALCLAVEHKHRELGQSLISAWQLSQVNSPESLGLSPTLVEATVAAGVQAGSAVDFTRVLNRDRFLGNLAWLAFWAMLTGAGVCAIATTNTMSIWFARNILLQNVAWPQATYLTIVGASNGKVTIPRGDDFTQVVLVAPESWRDPETVYIDYQPAQGRPRETLRQVGTRRFEAMFPAVMEPFAFRVRGGDEITNWVRVELVDRPAVESLSLRITPPTYTGLPAAELPPGKGPFDLLQGSTLSLHGEANKRLSQAMLQLPEGTAPLAISQDTSFELVLPASRVVEGTYAIVLRDQSQSEPLESKQRTQFALRLVPDREPRVKASVDGVSGQIVAQAVIPLRGEALDDFAVAAISVAHETRSAESQVVSTGKLPCPSAQAELGQPKAKVAELLEANKLGVVAGQNLVLRLEATDNNTVSGPGVGRAADILLQVVTEEQFRADLLRREKEQRQEFEHCLKQQEDLLTDCRALAVGSQGLPDLVAADRNTLMQAQRRQKLLATNVGAIANRLQAIVVEIRNNRLEEESGPLQMRLSQFIVDPMRQLADADIPAAQLPLDAARRLAADVPAREKALAEAIERQTALVAKMREILRHMMKSEGYQEAVNLLYAIQTSQQDVYNQSLKELQQRIQKILQPQP